MACGFKGRRAGAGVAAALVLALMAPEAHGESGESMGEAGGATTAAAPDRPTREGMDRPTQQTLVSRTLCRQVLAGERRPEGPRYVPGVDAHGDSVVPAEGRGGGGTSVLPEVLTVPLAVDPLKGSEQGALGLAGSLSLGRMMVGRDGRVLYDGRALGPDAEARLRRACRRAGRSGW